MQQQSFVSTIFVDENFQSQIIMAIGESKQAIDAIPFGDTRIESISEDIDLLFVATDQEW